MCVEVQADLYLKAASNLDWEIGRVWVSLSIDCLWIVGICAVQIYLVPTF
jgi:hypothetical protein